MSSACSHTCSLQSNPGRGAVCIHGDKHILRHAGRRRASNSVMKASWDAAHSGDEPGDFARRLVFLSIEFVNTSILILCERCSKLVSPPCGGEGKNTASALREAALPHALQSSLVPGALRLAFLTHLLPFCFIDWALFFTDILAGFFNNRVLLLAALFSNTSFRPGNSGLLRVYIQAF